MSIETKQIYKCDICGNIVEVLVAGKGELICCGEPMKLMEVSTADSSTEKHVPVIETKDGGVRVVVGSTPHPMIDKHYIQWIELSADGKGHRRYLSPGDPPEAFFPGVSGGKLAAREFCNIHGPWSTGS